MRRQLLRFICITNFFLLLFISPLFSFFWLFFPTIYFLFYGDLKNIFIIWIVFFLSWYLFFTGSIIVFGYTDVIWIRFEENSYEHECILKLVEYINPEGPGSPIFSTWSVLTLRSFCYQTYIILACIGVSSLAVPPYVPSLFRGLLILLKLILGG